jgi:hypothetical protein
MRKAYVAVTIAIVLLAAAGLMNGTTINGIANQLVTGLTQYGVVVGGGSGDLGTVSPSSTSGYALLSNGTSANPSFGQVPNGGLVNSAITITPSGCLSGGGSVSLGASVGVSGSGCSSMAGVTNSSATGAVTWTVANGDLALTLTGNVTLTVTVAGGDQWRKVNIQACQDATGSRTITWPSNVKGNITIGTTASKCSMQSFESFDGTNLYAVGTGVISQ